MQFSSREVFVNEDPLPYREMMAFSRVANLEKAPNSRAYVYEPRPEYDRPQHNPTNPILVAAREDIVTWADTRAAYEWWADDFDLAPDIPEQRHPDHVGHARRVLTRLANLTKEED